MTIGQKVICNGYEGTVSRILDGQLNGMIEVRLSSGVVCIDMDAVRVPSIQAYTLTIGGRRVRKATKVVTRDGREFKFTESMSRRNVITQLENMLAMAIHHKSADEGLLTEALEAVLNDSSFPKVSA